MARPFRERLASTPVVLEVVPPHRRASAKAVRSLVDRVADALRSARHIDAVNVPEILDENHMGQPYYRNLEPREFVARLEETTSLETIVNKVVVHLPSAAAFRSWLRDSLRDRGLRNLVFVGGSTSRVRYPGPTVLEANGIVRALARKRPDVAIGNITIPERDREIERLVDKTRAGCDFFTSQVLFEVEPMATVLRAYGKRCAAAGLRPATFLLSFAPVSDYQDLEFLLWLGANITPRTEESLLGTDGRSAEAASLRVARTIWSRLSAAASQVRPAVPLGINIEEVAVHNFDLAVRMAQEFPSWRESR